ncbi:RluA family pseudouridine synthase [Hydrogenophaga defluvii]|uniref:Pseudouridine synthase n=1 Tax=Hydrogenophaga defluvii TaxID=249410 RepID=A0ABW2SB52_9BURK
MVSRPFRQEQEDVQDVAEEIISTGSLCAVDDIEQASERRTLRADAVHHGERLDRVLALLLPEFSRAYLQQHVSDGNVQLNQRVVLKPATKLRAGDVIDIELRPTAQAQAFVPEAMALDVVFEDADLMVVNKPAGLVVHPAAGNWSGTLLNGLLAHHAGAARLPRAGIVHRLDKDTSGLMLVGKSQRAVDALGRMIAAREVQRLYLALAHGPWRHGGGLLVDQPMARDSRNRLRMAVVRGEGAGKPAQTRFLVLDETARHVLLACKLHTGRTHQIRVHAAWLGQPLVADVLYGGRPDLGLSRQALHAHRLSLAHPVTGDTLCFDCPPPADLLAAIAAADLQYNGATWWQALAS